MAQDDFSYDAETFVVGEAGLGVDFRKLEADYAELYMEVVSDGRMTDDRRARLDRAADVFGLDRGRLAQLEQAMQAELDARRPTQPASSRSGSVGPPPTPGAGPAPHSAGTARIFVPEDAGAAGEGGSLAPFDETTDPRLHALNGRIAFLEQRNTELEARCKKLEARNTVLEERMLGMTVEVDLTDVAARAGSRGAPPSGAVQAQSASFVMPPVRSAELSPAALEARLQEAPRDVEALRGLYRVLKRSADVGRRWCAAHALVYLGAADEEERATWEKGRAGALIQPTRALTTEEWRDFVLHPDQESLIGEIFGEIAPAVLLARVASARRDGALPSLERAQHLDLATSNVLAGRCFAWSAAILGTTAPPVYADPAYPGVVELVFATPLASRVGAAALGPRMPRELAFAIGRHLTWYRKQHFMSVLAASVEALEDLFLAALSIGNPGLPLTSDVRRRIEPVANAIEPLLDPAGQLRLRAAFLRFVEQGGRTNLRRWAVASDRTAARAGFLLADDLAAADAMLALEEPARVEERMSELIGFCISEKYGVLRKRIGIAVAGAAS